MVSQTGIQCVVVLYGNDLKESAAIRSLADCCKQQSSLAGRLSILIYDNSPATHPPRRSDWPFEAMEYRHDAQNGGLAAAYNYGLTAAQRRNIEWMLLLDQDTALSASFFSSLLREIDAPPPQGVCAFVPKLMQNGAMLSPQVVGKFRKRPVAASFSGTSPNPLTALNSGACLRVQAVSDVGGFPREYWLDYLDHIMFHRLQSAGGRLVVLNVAVEHRLSLQNLENEITPERYANLLAAEWAFIRETGSGGGPLVHRLRLMKRAFSHFTTLRSKKYGLKTLLSAFS